ncbi:MAG: ribonuclease III [Pelagibacteraceae bacterium]
MDKKNINQIEKIIKVKFTNKVLLQKAFTHKSISKENELNNERLEFLGDRVLGLVIANYLNEKYPEDSEGSLDKKLAALVNKEICSNIILSFNLHKFINLSKSQKKNKAGNKKIYGDLCESLIGAIFLDKGFEISKKVILELWKENLKKSVNVVIDPKTQLQEYSLKKFKKLPIYNFISNTGPSHKPSFKVSVSIEGSKSFTGSGSSKKIAETFAAKKLLDTLKI